MKNALPAKRLLEHFDGGYWITTNWKLAELVKDPDVPVTEMVYVPTGVPGSLVDELELPPQDPSHIVEHPRTRISPRKRAPRNERLREDTTKTTPRRPGSRVA